MRPDGLHSLIQSKGIPPPVSNWGNQEVFTLVCKDTEPLHQFHLEDPSWSAGAILPLQRHM